MPRGLTRFDRRARHGELRSAERLPGICTIVLGLIDIGLIHFATHLLEGGVLHPRGARVIAELASLDEVRDRQCGPDGRDEIDRREWWPPGQRTRSGRVTGIRPADRERMRAWRNLFGRLRLSRLERRQILAGLEVLLRLLPVLQGIFRLVELRTDQREVVLEA